MAVYLLHCKTCNSNQNSKETVILPPASFAFLTHSGEVVPLDLMDLNETLKRYGFTLWNANIRGRIVRIEKKYVLNVRIYMKSML